MSNTLGTLNGALVLQRALTLTFTQRPMLSMISKGFRDIDGAVDNALLGQSVKTRIKSVQSVQPFGTGAQDVSDTDVNVSLSDHKEVHVAFGPNEYNATNRDLIDEVAQPIAVAIANHIVDSVASLWTAANFSNSITPSANTYAALMVALRKKMGQAGIPSENRFLVVNSDVYGDLLSDPIIVAALNNPQNANAIGEGKLPAVSGIQIAEYPSLDALTTTKRIGFAGNPESTLYVARAPKGPGEVAGSLNFPGVLDYIEDPATGFRVQVTQWVDPVTMVVNNRLSWLQGFAKGNGAMGLLVKGA